MFDDDEIEEISTPGVLESSKWENQEEVIEEPKKEIP